MVHGGAVNTAKIKEECSNGLSFAGGFQGIRGAQALQSEAEAAGAADQFGGVTASLAAAADVSGISKTAPAEAAALPAALAFVDKLKAAASLHPPPSGLSSLFGASPPSAPSPRPAGHHWFYAG